MWQFALLAIGLLPFMSIGQAVDYQTYMGEDVVDNQNDLPANSSGGIMVESLMNIRTVASLTIEEDRIRAFQFALSVENPHPVRRNLVKGSTGGISQLVQMFGMALMFWFGGWLLFRFPEKYSFEDMMISMFGLLFGLTGVGVALADMADSAKAKVAAKRIFDLIDRQSEIDPLNEAGRKDIKSPCVYGSKKVLIDNDEEEEEVLEIVASFGSDEGNEKKKKNSKGSTRNEVSSSVIKTHQKSLSPKIPSNKHCSPGSEEELDRRHSQVSSNSRSPSGPYHRHHQKHHHHHHHKRKSSKKLTSKKDTG